MKARATPKGGQAIGKQVLRLKRNDFVDSILSREAKSNSKLRTTLQLYREVIAAMDRLALHTAGNRERLSRFAVATLAQTCVETALLLPRVNDPDLGIEHPLAFAIKVCVERFSQAVKAKPERFIAAARASLEWPVLWLMKGDANGHEELAQRLQLGAGFPFKTEGALHLDRTPMKAVVDAWRFLSAIHCIVKDDPKLRIQYKETKQTVEHLGSIVFPPLTKDPASIDFWWKKGIKPILEAERAWLGTSGALTGYLKRADTAKKKSCATRGGKDPYRAKADTKAWNGFLTDCNQALLRLAPRVTDKTHKKP